MNDSLKSFQNSDNKINKFQNISNQELIEEYCRRAKEGKISKDSLIEIFFNLYVKSDKSENKEVN